MTPAKARELVRLVKDVEREIQQAELRLPEGAKGWTAEQMRADREWKEAWNDRIDRLRFEGQGDSPAEIAEAMGEPQPKACGYCSRKLRPKRYTGPVERPGGIAKRLCPGCGWPYSGKWKERHEAKVS